MPTSTRITTPPVSIRNLSSSMVTCCSNSLGATECGQVDPVAGEVGDHRVAGLLVEGRGIAGMAACITHDQTSAANRRHTTSDRVAWTACLDIPTEDTEPMVRVMQGLTTAAPVLKTMARISARGRKPEESLHPARRRGRRTEQRQGWPGSFLLPDRPCPPGRSLLLLVTFAHRTDRISRTPHQAGDPDVGALHPGDPFKAVDRLESLADGLWQLRCHCCGPDEELLVPSPELEVCSRRPYADRGRRVDARVLARTSTVCTSLTTFVVTVTGPAMSIAASHLLAALKLPRLDHARTRGPSCSRSRRPPAQPLGKQCRLSLLWRLVLVRRRLLHPTEPAFATSIQHQPQNHADDVHSGNVPPHFPYGLWNRSRPGGTGTHDGSSYRAKC